MKAVKQILGICLAESILTGCSSEPETSDVTADSKASFSPEVLQLVGPGGTIGIGGTLEEAKKAFPAPPKAMVIPASASFAILGTQGWTWGREDNKEGFEVAIRDGKAVAMARALGKGHKEPADTIKALGHPDRKAIGKNGAMYVWDSGDDSRIVVTMGPKFFLLPNGAMTMIGNKNDLKLLSYDRDDPKTFVTMLDAMGDQAPKISKTVKDAFEKADKKTLWGN